MHPLLALILYLIAGMISTAILFTLLPDGVSIYDSDGELSGFFTLVSTIITGLIIYFH